MFWLFSIVRPLIFGCRHFLAVVRCSALLAACRFGRLSSHPFLRPCSATIPVVFVPLSGVVCHFPACSGCRSGRCLVATLAAAAPLFPLLGRVFRSLRRYPVICPVWLCLSGRSAFSGSNMSVLLSIHGFPVQPCYFYPCKFRVSFHGSSARLFFVVRSSNIPISFIVIVVV